MDFDAKYAVADPADHLCSSRSCCLRRAQNRPIPYRLQWNDGRGATIFVREQLLVCILWIGNCRHRNTQNVCSRRSLRSKDAGLCMVVRLVHRHSCGTAQHPGCGRYIQPWTQILPMTGKWKHRHGCDNHISLDFTKSFLLGSRPIQSRSTAGCQAIRLVTGMYPPLGGCASSLTADSMAQK